MSQDGTNTEQFTAKPRADWEEQEQMDAIANVGGMNLESAISGIPDAVSIHDANGRVIQFNEAFARFYRFESRDACAEQLLNLGELFEASLPDGKVVPTDMWVVSRALRGETGTNVEYALRRKGAGEAWIGSHSFSPILDEKGAVTGCVVIGRDVTEQREREEQSRLAQKMDAVAHLAGGVAHDFNDLLQVILVNAQVVQCATTQDTESWDAIDEVIRAAQRAAHLTRQLLVFSRRQDMQAAHTDLNVLIEDVLKRIRRLVGERIEIIFTPAHLVDPVLADKDQIEQVLVNLCINARDAMPRGGKITIATHDAVLEKGKRYVLVSVADTGQGMDAATLAHVYEPFFTAKGILDGGMGLGLGTVYGIVKQHEGLLHVNSSPGEGTVFRIYLPSAELPAERTEEVRAVSAVPGTETILVAEDDPAVLKMISMILKPAGYTVLTAVNGKDALRAFHDHAGEIDLVLLDIVMPGMGGREVMEEIVASGSKVPFLFSSGYSEDVSHANFVAERGMELIQKPYCRELLLGEVRRILDASRCGNASKDAENSY